MSKNQVACCPNCGGRIPFKKFVQLNNFSATHCSNCKTWIEISNRTANAVIAGVSGVLSAAAIILCTYAGYNNYKSFFGGLFSGICLATLILVFICWYAYRHSKLNSIYRE